MKTKQLISLLLLIGCTYSLSTLVVDHEYSKNVAIAKRLEPVVIQSVLIGEPLLSQRGSEDVLKLHAELLKLVESNNDRASRDPHFSVLTPKTALTEDVNVYYFHNGVFRLEQFFVFKAVNGHIFKLTLYWRNGECYETKTD